MSEKPYKPQTHNLRQVVAYLESIGLEVAGPNVDLATGQIYPSMRCFGPDDVVAYRDLYHSDGLIEPLTRS